MKLESAKIDKFIALLLLLALPLTGIVAAGEALAKYLEFPPVSRYVDHAPFSWPVFIFLAIAILAVELPFIARVIATQRKPKQLRQAKGGKFPWWGWCGLAFTLLAWFLAWTRFEWFEPLQRFTFSPIWFGYIVVVNGLSFKFNGHCLLRDRPYRLAGLFLLSAAFWWYFEYLNRFVQNWFYSGIGDLSAMQYFLFATLPFSTVLPAVLSTDELLRGFPRLVGGLDDYIGIDPPCRRTFAWLILIASAIALATVGVWPNYLFPMLWLSPLLVITALQAIGGRKTIFSPIRTGDWRRICRLALAALICGFFWEMWNYYSLAKWEYAIPFVGRFRIFEMPILGYAGYIPFGLECAVIADIAFRGPRADG